jgi:hypothetical protein
LIIATSNFFYNSSDFSLNQGSRVDGDVDNLGTSNFAERLTARNSTNLIQITLPNTAGTYLAIHGMDWGSYIGEVTIGLYISAGASDPYAEYTGFAPFSDLFLYFDDFTFAPTNPVLKIEYTSDTTEALTISYIAAGRSTEVPYKGINPGQVLPYLQFGYATKEKLNTNGQPMLQRLRKIPQPVNVNFKNVDTSWARGDLQDVFGLYHSTQVVSMLDFESEDYPTESWAAFNLKQSRVTTFSGTRSLVPVSLQFMAAG